mmetsp:Transcript_4467/g.13647  ORF Transcript_4467/g.13647 Transcript_4467/m.13647 type:complete len:190 (+) Transcript_4467:72-641(+)|eukprot:CAMPEP_0174243164 /NCGR_PEP_ID=MMETSP0417-20130205/30619_1 /TAXON_ID=242541 /ORGANISM="Mayorella sp, Strain BSH-02190019" /LENGTH=189 /DNA_ID=CAMNT_0015322629 /DNA_START=46 /DNA_END=615 /DNA_ORIENTATION=+
MGFLNWLVIGAAGALYAGPKRFPMVMREIGRGAGTSILLLSHARRAITRMSETNTELQQFGREINDTVREFGEIRNQMNAVAGRGSILSAFSPGLRPPAAHKNVGSSTASADAETITTASSATTLTPSSAQLPSSAANWHRSLPLHSSSESSPSSEPRSPSQQAGENPSAATLRAAIRRRRALSRHPAP